MFSRPGSARVERLPRTFGAAQRAAAPMLEPVSSTPQLDAQLLLAHVAGVSRSAVVAFPERELAPASGELFDALLARRIAGEPLAYLLGERGFYSLIVEVNDAVLVPRPETEHLIEELLTRLPKPLAGGDRARPTGGTAARGERPAVLDLGTGSGVLALTLKQQRPDVDVVGADASIDALNVARANGERLGLDVRWVETDWYSALGERRFDAILCNPPYIRSDDPHFEGPLRFEPRTALDGGSDGLEPIRRVLGGAPGHLKPGGLLLLEHGYDQQGEVMALTRACGLTVLAARRDLGGHDRYVVLQRA